jgi:hypothetical protein
MTSTPDMDLNGALADRFSAGEGVVNLSPSMSDEHVLTLIKLACKWSKGRAFQVVQSGYPVADVSQLKELNLGHQSRATVLENTNVFVDFNADKKSE